MKINKIVIISTLLFFIIAMGAVSASENATSQTLSIDENNHDAAVLAENDSSQSEMYYDFSEYGWKKIDKDSETVIDLDEYIEGPLNKTILKDYTPSIYANVYSSYNFSVVVDGELKVNKSINKLEKYDLKDLDIGLHTWNASLANENGIQIFRQGNFTVSYYESSLPPKEFDMPLYAGVSFIKGVSGNFIMLLDGELIYNKTFSGNEGTSHLKYLDGLSMGNHSYEFVFTSTDEQFESFKLNGSFKYLYPFYIYNENIRLYEKLVYGNSYLFYVYLPDETNGKGKVSCNGVNKTFKVKDGISEVTIDNLNIGKNVISFSYEDEKYPLKTVDYEVLVEPAIKAPANVEFGDDIVISLVLPSDAKGNLEIYETDGFDDSLIGNVSLVNGKASFNVTNIKSLTNYVYFVKYNGSDYDVDYRHITVKCLPKVYLYSSKSGGIRDMLCVELPDVAYDMDIQVSYCNNDRGIVDGYINIFKGQAKNKKTFSLPNIRPKCGFFDITVTVNDDGKGYSSEKWIRYYNPNIIADNLNAYYGDSKVLSAKIMDIDDNPAKNTNVVFKLDGKKLKSVKTDSNGIAKIKLGKYLPKTYKITIESLGIKKTVKLTVKQILALKKVNVKKSAKQLVLSATLKKGKQAMASKTITFKFNGKKYVKKTNRNGIAKVTIKKSVLSKLKVNKKLTYSATYSKDTVKKTIKVKK